MNESKKSSKTNAMRALLIAVDYYFPNMLADNGGYYHNLGVCVRDWNYIEKFIVSYLSISPKNDMKLTSSNLDAYSSGQQQQPPEPKERSPT